MSETPRFDFSRVSREWNRSFMRTMTRVSRATLTLQREPSDDMDDEAFNALLDRQEQALNDMEALGDEQAALLAQVLADVPAAWLLPDAPEGLDWSAVESLDWIQADRYAELLEMLRTRDIAGDEAKNSPGHTRSRRKRRGR